MVVLDGFERSLQVDIYSCGAQSAFMILRYFGKARSWTSVKRRLGTDQDGTDEGAILALLRERRLHPRIVERATLREIETAIRRGAPVLVAMDERMKGSHYAVVYGFSRSHIYLADPSVWRSIRSVIPRRRFRERWDRWAMFVRPD